MQPIPQPAVLDPDRVLTDARKDLTVDDVTRAEALERALHETCAYAQQLWQSLDEARNYLWNSVPPDPRGTSAARTGASPTGPDDDTGWESWIAAFARVTSTLVGPQGDSGFGHGEARQAAELRRTAPVSRLHAAHPELDEAARDTSPSQLHDNGVRNGMSPLFRAAAFGAGAGVALRLTRWMRR